MRRNFSERTLQSEQRFRRPRISREEQSEFDGYANDGERRYSKEQLEVVDRVLCCSDYYQILNVDRDVSDCDLKRSYKYLALKLHPDKNLAPRAIDAFKAIGNAFAVLSDEHKRLQYDHICGSDIDVTIVRQKSTRRHYYHSDNINDHHDIYDEDDFIWSDELIDALFRKSFRPANVQKKSYQRASAAQPQYKYRHCHRDNNTVSSLWLMQITPVMILFALTIVAFLSTSGPVYSLRQTVKYSSEMRTERWNILYYVEKDFSTTYKGNRNKLEREVENEYINILRFSCAKQQSYKESMLWRARYFRDEQSLQRAKKLGTLSCDKLQELHS